MNELAAIRQELHYAISLDEIVWGGVLLAITIAIHGTGMVSTLRVSQRLRDRFHEGGSPSFLLGLVILIVCAWMIVVVDLLEVLVWAGFYVWSDTAISLSQAFYFALVNYCTISSGYLPLRWRLLEGILGVAGMLTFAWSTGVLFALAQDFQAKHMRRS